MPIEASSAQQYNKMISASSPSKGDEKYSQQIKDNNHLIQTLAGMATNFINPFNTGGGGGTCPKASCRSGGLWEDVG